MADVGQFALLEPEAIDYENESTGGGGQNYAPPVEGRYTGKAPFFKDNGSGQITPDNHFGATQAGYLKVAVEPIEIVGPTGQGYNIRFSSLSAKKYSNREGNQIIDFLRACGNPARPKTNDEYKSAVKMCSGKLFDFALVWEAYNKDTQETTKGEQNFPPDPQDSTKHQPWIQDAFDSKKRWFANGKVKYYISAIKKG